MNWYKNITLSQTNKNDIHNTISIYRGMSQKFNNQFDLSNTDAPVGYSTWTDNPLLAREYAGKDGFIYKIELPLSKLGENLINNEGERALFIDNKKRSGLNNISGNEYLIYNYHDDYDENLISEYKII